MAALSTKLRSTVAYAFVSALALAGYLDASGWLVLGGATGLTLADWGLRGVPKSLHRSLPPPRMSWTSKTATYFATGVVTNLILSALAFAAGRVARWLLGWQAAGATASLHRNCRRDVRVRVVAGQLEILVAVPEEVRHVRVEVHPGERPGRAGELQVGLLHVVKIEVGVSQRVNEVAWLQPCHPGQHHGEQRIARDIERHPQEYIGRALVELAGEPPFGHIELKQAVAGRQGHVGQVCRVPGRDDHAAAFRGGLQRLHQLLQLIDGAPGRRGPGTPLGAIDGAKIAVLVGPFVPDGDTVGVEILGVGVSLQEPQQLVDHRLQVDLLGGDEREAGAKVKAHLVPEHAERSGARAVGLAHTLGAHPPHEIKILLHADNVVRFCRQPSCQAGRSTSRNAKATSEL